MILWSWLNIKFNFRKQSRTFIFWSWLSPFVNSITVAKNLSSKTQEMFNIEQLY